MIIFALTVCGILVIFSIVSVIALWSWWYLIGACVVAMVLLGSAAWFVIMCWDKISRIVERGRSVTVLKTEESQELKGPRISTKLWLQAPLDPRYMDQWRGEDVDVSEEITTQMTTPLPTKKGDEVIDGVVKEVERSISEVNTVFGRVPTMREMIDQGLLGADIPTIVAWEQRAQGWSPLTHKSPPTSGIAGIQGGGKTVSTLYQMLINVIFYNGDVRFLPIDPHMYADTGEELYARINAFQPYFLTKEELVPGSNKYRRALMNPDLILPNNGGKAFMAWVDIIRLEVDERLNGKKGPAWVLVIDEFSALMRKLSASDKKRVVQMLQDITQEARKVRINAILIGQDWRVSEVGEGVRQTIPLFIVHRMEENWARMVAPSDWVRVVPTLDTGEAVIVKSSGNKKGYVPFVDQDGGDIDYVLDTYPHKNPVYTLASDSSVHAGQVGYSRSEKGIILPDVGIRGQTVAGAFGEDAGGTRSHHGEVWRGEELDEIPPYDEEVLNEVARLYKKNLTDAEIAKLALGAKAGQELIEAKIKVREMVAWMISQQLKKVNNPT